MSTGSPPKRGGGRPVGGRVGSLSPPPIRIPPTGGSAGLRGSFDFGVMTDFGMGLKGIGGTRRVSWLHGLDVITSTGRPVDSC